MGHGHFSNISARRQSWEGRQYPLDLFRKKEFMQHQSALRHRCQARHSGLDEGIFRFR
jgi:hypothetical protein